MDFRDIKEFFRDTFKYIVLIVVVILVFVYIVSIQQVVGPSMQNTLKEGDVVFVNKFIYKISDVGRGDVVVFEYNGMKNLVKRVIGLPGENIVFKDNNLYIDGVLYKETYLSSDTEDFSLKELGYDVVPEDYYLVLGDNRADSMDSREIGLINKKDLIGKVGIRIYPFNKIGLTK